MGNAAPIPDPISVEFELQIFREQDLTFGDIFVVFPSFNSISPDPITSDTLESPTGKSSGHTDAGGGAGSGSALYSSLNQALDECTNGFWTLTINSDDPSEKQYFFTVSISGLTSNVLAPVTIAFAHQQRREYSHQHLLHLVRSRRFQFRLCQNLRAECPG